MKVVSMKDIARELNVSVVSVSKTLAGQKGVGRELREKILRKARELGYIYNGLPQDLSKPQANAGIIVAERFFSDNSYYAKLYKFAAMRFAEAGIASVLEIVTEEREAKLIMPQILTDKKCEGVILLGETTPEYVRMIVNTGIPYILMDFYIADADYDSVISDGISGTYQLTRYLIKLGYKRIAYVGSRLATSSILDRYLGYHKALLVSGISDHWILPDRDKKGTLIEVELPDDMPDAFVCNCDDAAFALAAQLKRRGLKIPQDVTVVGFDDSLYATLCDPALTTYRVNASAMGKIAASRLLRKMTNQIDTPGCSVVGGAMVIRKSTPTPPAS